MPRDTGVAPVRDPSRKPDSRRAASSPDRPARCCAASWTKASNELAFFVGLLTSQSVDEAFAAQDNFVVGAQNFSFASRAGDIAWSTQSRIPQRQAAACSFNIESNGTVTGISPLYVLPGNGGFEWESDLADPFIPHDVNPARGYIATANQANVPVTRDGNPCNDAHYIGGDFAVGYRMGRIVERLDEATAAAEAMRFS